MTCVDIGGYRIGLGYPTFVIAEAGVNHNGDIKLAKRMVELAARAGAHAVKFQSFRSEGLVLEDAPQARYQMANTGRDESQLSMLKRLELSAEAHHELVEFCREKGILFLSTPFEEDSLDLLDSLDVPAFKVSSGDLTNLPFLTKVAGKGRPIILSTGMATLGEVETALRAIQATGNQQTVLLHCVSNYPSHPHETNLRAMQTLSTAFQVPVGYSDHTMGITVTLAAVAMGATVIEKHFTFNRSLPGPDQPASLEPDELAALVREVQVVQSAMGTGVKWPSDAELETAKVARKSIVTAVDIPADTVLESGMVTFKRPGTGIGPALLDLLLGRRARQDLKVGTVLQLDHLA